MLESEKHIQFEETEKGFRLSTTKTLVGGLSELDQVVNMLKQLDAFAPNPKETAEAIEQPSPE